MEYMEYVIHIVLGKPTACKLDIIKVIIFHNMPPWLKLDYVGKNIKSNYLKPPNNKQHLKWTDKM